MPVLSPIRTTVSRSRSAPSRVQSFAVRDARVLVQTGGFDTHATQGVQGGGTYGGLMGTFGDGIAAFYNDLRNQGLLSATLILQFSEFGRRISENGSGGTLSLRRP